MQPKTQMRIGLWGAVLIVVYIIFRMISNMPLSLAKLAVFLFWLIMYGTYILSIIRKNLKTVKIVYYLYLTVVIILFCGYFVSSIVLFRKSGDYHSLKVDYVFLFCNMLIYGLEIFILCMGIIGLQKTIETESELKIENISAVEEKAGDQNDQ